MTEDVPDQLQPLQNKELALAYIEALATTGGADAVCALFVERLRASGDALHGVLADMLDVPVNQTGICFKLNLGRKDYPNPARDIEIDAHVEALDAASYAQPANTDASADENRAMLRHIGGRIASEANPKLQKAMEQEFREHFRYFHMSPIAKARMLLLGFVETDAQGMPLPPLFPKAGSLLHWECSWSLVEVLERRNPPPGIVRLVAPQIVPDDDQGLAGVRRVVFKYRSRGNRGNDFRSDAVAASVRAAVAEGAMVKNAERDMANQLARSTRQVRRLRRKSTGSK
ncbi:hypothetical protein [Phyllobacterium sp. UNC302MFCol5.2]|uniref:hypothetical protein n=1 Tax=Phyllobacterium sp. UNC302MFCol5.2 TaxID=1449065 RepID=UPI0004851A8D|nr:hypothetical protein [Phyllobacterium sp. UNC302MFCol5.2]